jgi:hypothetical protein
MATETSTPKDTTQTTGKDVPTTSGKDPEVPVSPN